MDCRQAGTDRGEEEEEEEEWENPRQSKRAKHRLLVRREAAESCRCPLPGLLDFTRIDPDRVYKRHACGSVP